MCGIAGIVHFDGARADSDSALRMARTLAHRGPDGEGVYASGNVALSFRRLSIIDLSDNASQPMSNEDGSVWLVFNGEIYNYVELMPFLLERGHKFRSHCDSEVILHTYEEDGVDCTKRFNGMWGFAIWDSRQRRLMLSRDRLGEKPLYYLHHQDVLIFASEVKAILSVRPDLVEADLAEVSKFLAHGDTDSRQETLFRNIKQVQPGHSVVFGADGSRRISRYWHAPEPGEVEPIPRRQAESKFRELLYDSVRIRLRSDVPLGTGLSGGVDSTSILAVTCRIMRGAPVHTFSSILKEPGYSEERFISAANAAFPTVPHTTTPSPDFMALLPRSLWHQEIPFVNPGVNSQWSVMELARKTVKVVLDGQGADELLGGYFYFYPDHLADLLRRAWEPRSLGHLFLALGRIARRNPPRQTASILREAMGRLRGVPMPAGFQGGTYSDYLHPDLTAILRDEEESMPSPVDRFLASALYNDVTTSSLPRLLHYQDRNSMAHSIESRLPFLDPRLVEFCLRLPDSLRIHAGVTKILLRRAFRKELPEIVRNRQDKKGFSEPFQIWMRGKGYDQVADVLLSRSAVSRNITRRDRVEKALAEQRAGLNRSVPLYRLLTLEVWFRLFQDGEGFPRFHSPATASAIRAESGKPATS